MSKTVSASAQHSTSSSAQATAAAALLAQNHLVPKLADQKLGSANNELDLEKRNYIIKMRQNLASGNSKHITFDDGSLNFKYFNVKKGHYWSKEENEKLLEGVVAYGATDFKTIKNRCFKDSNWSETEIRLRVCRLLKCYDLQPYHEKRFSGRDELLECARKNKEEAIKQKKSCGGILYNPPVEVDEGIMNSFFNQKKQTTAK